MPTSRYWVGRWGWRGPVKVSLLCPSLRFRSQIIWKMMQTFIAIYVHTVTANIGSRILAGIQTVCWFANILEHFLQYIYTLWPAPNVLLWVWDLIQKVCLFARNYFTNLRLAHVKYLHTLWLAPNVVHWILVHCTNLMLAHVIYMHTMTATKCGTLVNGLDPNWM